MHIVNYLLPTLSQRTNAHLRGYNTCNVNYKIKNDCLCMYLETSKSFTFQSHHSKFVVIKLSELPQRQCSLHCCHDFWFVLVFGCLILLCITLRTLKIKRSTNVIVSNLLGDKILFSTFYTGLFLLFGKTTGRGGGGHGPPGPPPCYGPG